MGISAGPDIVEDGLVLHLDAGNRRSYPGNGTTWTDLTGNGGDGTLVNGPVYNSSNLGSFVFDGANDYINCGDKDIFKISSQLTLEAIFNISSYVGWSGIIGKSNSSGGIYVMQLRPASQKIRFSYNSISPPYDVNVVDGNYTLNTNTWIHSVVTYDGNTVKLYINGLLDKSQNIGSITFITSPGYPLTIGQDPPGANEFFNGKIAKASIYNRALTQQEVSQNFNALRGRYGI